eukprot:TRINITY_DN6362_c0_g1_i1.p1 TRINITY_DN6362_c0_g1~~TRINITY_DN6362_c0_g1_i1.p1  ORF type:complete len:1073 (+),score=265.70 TRINITY_DN6362_c0_g1_i1:6-3224(+)
MKKVGASTRTAATSARAAPAVKKPASAAARPPPTGKRPASAAGAGRVRSPVRTAAAKKPASGAAALQSLLGTKASASVGAARKTSPLKKPVSPTAARKPAVATNKFGAKPALGKPRVGAFAKPIGTAAKTPANLRTVTTAKPALIVHPKPTARPGFAAAKKSFVAAKPVAAKPAAKPTAPATAQDKLRAQQAEAKAKAAAEQAAAAEAELQRLRMEMEESQQRAEKESAAREKERAALESQLQAAREDAAKAEAEAKSEREAAVRLQAELREQENLQEQEQQAAPAAAKAEELQRQLEEAKQREDAAEQEAREKEENLQAALREQQERAERAEHEAEEAREEVKRAQEERSAGAEADEAEGRERHLLHRTLTERAGGEGHLPEECSALRAQYCIDVPRGLPGPVQQACALLARAPDEALIGEALNRLLRAVAQDEEQQRNGALELRSYTETLEQELLTVRRTLMCEGRRGKRLPRGGEVSLKGVPAMGRLVWGTLEDAMHGPYKLFGPRVTSDDVCEGGLGDSVLMAALSTLARVPNFITSIVTELRDHKYKVRFYKPGFGYEHVTVDSTVPCVIIRDPSTGFSSDSSSDGSSDEGGNNFGALGKKRQLRAAFAQPGTQGAVWPLVVEKALAKWRGGYSRLTGLQLLDVVTWLTGAPVEELDLQMNPKTLWNVVEGYLKMGFVVTCMLTKRDKAAEKDVVKHCCAVLKLASAGVEVRDPFVRRDKAVGDLPPPAVLPKRLQWEDFVERCRCAAAGHVKEGWVVTSAVGTLSNNAIVAGRNPKLGCLFRLRSTKPCRVQLYVRQYADAETLSQCARPVGLRLCLFTLPAAAAAPVFLGGSSDTFVRGGTAHMPTHASIDGGVTHVVMVEVPTAAAEQLPLPCVLFCYHDAGDADAVEVEQLDASLGSQQQQVLPRAQQVLELYGFSLPDVSLGACPACGVDVSCDGVVSDSRHFYHPGCFKCATCSKTLQTIFFSLPNGNIQCEDCYGKTLPECCACHEKLTTNDRWLTLSSTPAPEDATSPNARHYWHHTCLKCAKCSAPLQRTTACGFPPVCLPCSLGGVETEDQAEPETV